AHRALLHRNSTHPLPYTTLFRSVCTPDSLRQYSPFHDPSATPIGTGYRSKFGANVQGGSETLRYFVSGEREDEMSVLKLPTFERSEEHTSELQSRGHLVCRLLHE